MQSLFCQISLQGVTLKAFFEYVFHLKDNKNIQRFVGKTIDKETGYTIIDISTVDISIRGLPRGENNGKHILYAVIPYISCPEGIPSLAFGPVRIGKWTTEAVGLFSGARTLQPETVGRIFRN